jgi:starch synthase
MQIYFIDNEDFFHKRLEVCDKDGKEYKDNDDRCIFFVRGVLETIKKLRWIPDLIHCHGWMSALTPLYIRRMYADDPCFKDSKTVYSIYDQHFKNKLNPRIINKLIADGATEADLEILKKGADFEAITRLALSFADGVIQGSPTLPADAKKALSSAEGKPFLPYHGKETYIEAFNSFYDTILNEA